MNLDRNNLNRTPSSAPDEIDHLLAPHFASGEGLAPSSGFARSVMEAAQAEASVPPPIPFPWRRVVPGLVAMLCVLIGLGTFAFRGLRSLPAADATQRGMLLSLTQGPAIHLTTWEQGLCWIAASAFIALATIAASMRLASGHSSMRV